MADYTYESELVADPFTFQRAANSAITVYDVTDENETTPLALKDLNGLPLPNPLTSSADAFVPPFVTTSPQVKMVGGGLRVAKPSFQGVRDEAVAARLAAENAQAEATNAGANAAEVASEALAGAVSDAQSAAVAAAASAALVGAPADSAIAAAVAGPASSTRAAVNTAIRTEANLNSYLIDIRSFLGIGETLDRNAGSSMSWLFQRAVDTLSAQYIAQPGRKRGYVIDVPNGEYRFDTKLNWKTGVGINGASVQETRLLPFGRTTLFDAPTIVTGGAWNPLDTIDDTSFTNFTADCINQSHTAYDANVKAFKIQNARRMLVENVHLFDSWATQLGNDRLFDSVYKDVISNRAGRGKRVFADGADAFATGAGIGMATGFLAEESLMMINCQARDNFSHGFFTELSNSTILTPQMSKGYVMIGCVASGNTTGVQDSGSVGLQISGGSFYNNATAGISVRGTSASSNMPGRDGNVSGAQIWGNKHGVALWQVPNQGYSFLGNTIIENTENGIYITDAKSSHTTISNNDILRNGSSGIRVRTDTDRLKIDHNRIRDNGQNPAGETRDGINISQPSNYVSIVGNIITDTQVSKTQQNAVSIVGSGLVANRPRITDNDLQGNLAASLNITQTMASQIVRDNFEGAAVPSGTIMFSDDFNRADGALGTTSVGAKTWAAEGAGGYSGVIAGNKAKVTGGTTSLGYVVADSGISDGVVKVTASGMDSTRQAGVLLRYVDANNYVSLLYRVSGSDLHYRLSRRVAGTSTDILALTTLSQPGDVIEVTMNGSNYAIKVNGVTVGTATSSYHASATKQGFAITNPAAQADTTWDDISVKTL